MGECSGPRPSAWRSASSASRLPLPLGRRALRAGTCFIGAHRPQRPPDPEGPRVLGTVCRERGLPACPAWGGKQTKAFQAGLSCRGQRRSRAAWLCGGHSVSSCSSCLRGACSRLPTACWTAASPSVSSSRSSSRMAVSTFWGRRVGDQAWLSSLGQLLPGAKHTEHGGRPLRAAACRCPGPRPGLRPCFQGETKAQGPRHLQTHPRLPTPPAGAEEPAQGLRGPQDAA